MKRRSKHQPYESAKMTVIYFDSEDVIRASGIDSGDFLPSNPGEWDPVSCSKIKKG